MRALSRPLAFAALAALLGCSSVPRPTTTEESTATPEAEAAGAPSELLAGHLRVELPAGAVDAPRRASIMAAPQSAADETRVVLEGGGPEGLARFVMMASELYLLGSGDLHADAKRLAARSERVVDLPGAKVPLVVLEPTANPPPDRPVFVLGAVVAHPDGSLQEVTFFILPEMVNEKAAYMDRARAIVKTLEAGTRKLEAKGGPTKLGETLEVDLPPGFLVAKQPGPDFEVYRVRKLSRAGEPGATLGVYVGGHPSLQHTQAAREGGPEPPTKTEEGTLLGQSTSWILWSTPDGVKIKETVVKVGEGEAVHVFALAGADEDIGVLMKIASTLKRTK